MSRLTRQEQLVLAILLFLIATGWTVRAWKAAHSVAMVERERVSSAP